VWGLDAGALDAEGDFENMTDFSPAGGARRKKKKSALASDCAVNGTAKHEGSHHAQIDETDQSASDPVGGVERTRRLFQASLRLWELKRRIRD